MRDHFPRLRSLTFGLALLMAALMAPAASAEAVRVDTVLAELVADTDAVVPGQPLRLGLRLVHDPQWHTYWRNPGESGLPTQFPLEMPDGFSAGEIQWPFPTRILIPPLANLGYEDDLLLMREVVVPAQIDAGEVRFETLGQWLVCREVCVPGEARLQLVLPVAEASGPGPYAQAFAMAWSRLPADPAPVDVARLEDRLQIHLPDAMVPADVSRLEFFPYRESVVQYAEAQTLLRLPDGRGWRLEVPLSPDYTQPPPGLMPVGLAQAAEGIVVIDEQRSLALAPSAVQGGEAFTAQGQPRLIEGHLVPFMAAQQSAASSLLAAGRQRASAELVASPVTAPAAAALPAPAAQASGIGQSVWMAMVLAMIGGLILNLMPCVFPVIGLKILGFAGSGAGGQEALTIA
ncbi:MAG: protein-disulfide reductase DsbD family protein [Burkholderiaceae bacterium]